MILESVVFNDFQRGFLGDFKEIYSMLNPGQAAAYIIHADFKDRVIILEGKVGPHKGKRIWIPFEAVKRMVELTEDGVGRNVTPEGEKKPDKIEQVILNLDKNPPPKLDRKKLRK